MRRARQPPTACRCSATSARTPAGSSRAHPGELASCGDGSSRCHAATSWSRWCTAHGATEVGLNIETKFDVLPPRRGRAARAVRRGGARRCSHDAGLVARTTMQSFDWAVLRLVRAAEPRRCGLNALTNTDYLEVDQPGASPWLAGLDIDDFGDSVPGRGQLPGLRRDLAEPHDPDARRWSPRRTTPGCGCCPTPSTTPASMRRADRDRRGRPDHQPPRRAARRAGRDGRRRCRRRTPGLA